jgi:hypothetical protein
MSQSKAEAIVAQLLTNAAGVRYGTVTVSLKLHEGRVVEVTHLTSTQTKEPKNKPDTET